MKWKRKDVVEFTISLSLVSSAFNLGVALMYFSALSQQGSEENFWGVLTASIMSLVSGYIATKLRNWV